MFNWTMAVFIFRQNTKIDDDFTLSEINEQTISSITNF